MLYPSVVSTPSHSIGRTSEVIRIIFRTSVEARWGDRGQAQTLGELPGSNGCHDKRSSGPVRGVATERADVHQADEEAGWGAVARGSVERHRAGGAGESGGADAA